MAPPPPGHVFTARHLWLTATLLLLVAGAGYFPALGNPLLSDDLNLRVLFTPAGPDWEQIGAEIRSGWGGLVGAAYYRPLLTYSVLADYFFWGANPWGYHLTNLLLHALNALLVGHLILRLAGPGKHYPALLAAAVFALHPLHPEAVAWVAGRVDTLSAFFYLLSLRLYVAYRWTGRRRYLALSLAAMALGLLTKESVATLPAVLLLLDVGLKLARGTPHWARGVRFAVLAHGALLGAYLAVRYRILGGLTGGQDLLGPYRNWEAWLATGKQTGVKLFLLLAPVNGAVVGPPWRTLLQLGIVLLLILPFLELMTHGRRTIPGPLLGLALIVVPLGLVGHIHVDPRVLTNSRVLYLPVAGLLLLLYSAPWNPRVRHELRRLGAAQMAVLSGFLAVAYFAVLRANLSAWVHAGRTLRRVVAAADRAERETPPGKFLVLLHLPDQVQGAYVCRNGFLFALVRPFHHRDLKRIFPVLDYFYAQDPGMLRAVYGPRTRILLWDERAERLRDLPPAGAVPPLPPARRRALAALAGPAWEAEPGLRRRGLPGGGVELLATRAGAGLRSPFLGVPGAALAGLAFVQEGAVPLALGWSRAESPDRFPVEPEAYLPPREGPRVVALVNHATWYLPGGPAVGRLRLVLLRAGVPVRLRRVRVLRRLPPLSWRGPRRLVSRPGADLPLPVGPAAAVHFKAVCLNPAAPLSVPLHRPAGSTAPLRLPAHSLRHLHRVARALGGFTALLYVDATEPDGRPLTTRARSPLVTVFFPPP